MATQEFEPIGAATLLLPSQIEENHLGLIFRRAPGIAHQQCPGSRFDFSHDERRSLAALVAEHPIDVMGHGELAHERRAIHEFESCNFDRVRQRYELLELRGDAP